MTVYSPTTAGDGPGSDATEAQQPATRSVEAAVSLEGTIGLDLMKALESGWYCSSKTLHLCFNTLCTRLAGLARSGTVHRSMVAWLCKQETRMVVTNTVGATCILCIASTNVAVDDMRVCMLLTF